MIDSQASFEQIVDQLCIPSGLIDHLYRVAGVAECICDNWTGPRLDRSMLRRVLLLHDIGNVVKMDADKEDEARLRDCFISEFGDDDHAVSEAISKQCGLSDSEIKLMQGKTFLNNDWTVVSASWEQKIGAYADQRLEPQGVSSLNERLAEAKERYKNQPGTSMNNPRTDFLISCALEIERQLFEYLPMEPAAISTERADQYRPVLSNEKYLRPAWTPRS